MGRGHADSGYESSHVTALPQLSLWELPCTQDSVLGDTEYEVRPLSTFSSSTPLRFEVRSPADEYVLFNETHIWLKVRIKLSHPTKENITYNDWNEVTPAQNILHTMFRHVSLSVNNRQIGLSPSLYSYRSFIEQHLGFSKETRNGHLTASGWGDDVNSRRRHLFDGVDPMDHTVCEFDVEGSLHLDVTFQEKALLGATDLLFEFLPNHPRFYMKTTNGFVVDVQFADTVLYVHRMRVSHELRDAHAEALKIAPARYAMTRCEVYHTTISANKYDEICDNIVVGTLPRRMIVGLISTAAFNGLTPDPFAFSHFNLNFITCYLDGVPHPMKPYTPDFSRNIYAREFRSLYRALNQTGTQNILAIDKWQWKERPLFAFNFSPDLSNGGSLFSHVSKRQKGHLRIHFKFAEKLPEPVVVIAYCEFDSLIQIDAERNIRTDF